MPHDNFSDFPPDIRKALEFLSAQIRAQTARDGVARNDLFEQSRSKVCDEWSESAGDVAGLLLELTKNRSVISRLAAFADQHPELIRVDNGQSKSQAAVTWLETKFLAGSATPR